MFIFHYKLFLSFAHSNITTRTVHVSALPLCVAHISFAHTDTRSVYEQNHYQSGRFSNCCCRQVEKYYAALGAPTMSPNIAVYRHINILEIESRKVVASSLENEPKKMFYLESTTKLTARQHKPPLFSKHSYIPYIIWKNIARDTI